jgi:uncharacterized membrane protein YhhN
LLFIGAAVGYIVGAGLDHRRLTRFTKPFAMPLLVAAYLLACRSPSLWIVVGLGCGAVGDVCLMYAERKRYFVAGLAAFLLGHLAYLAAFLGPVVRAGVTSPWAFAAAVPFAAFGVLVYRTLRPGLGTMKVPVALYTGVILAMAMAAFLRVFSVGALLGWLPLLGALSFMVSDTLLAYQRFREPIPFGRTLKALTYVAAQSLIVLGYLKAGGLRGV